MLTIDMLGDATWKFRQMCIDLEFMFDDVGQVFPNAVINEIKELTRDAVEDFTE